MPPERSTFSPFWHRVRAMAPRLRPHVQITRQLYRRRRWHVVHDPATNQFYRLNPIAHEFVGLLDGARSVEEVWKISLARHGDSAPTQNEVLQLLGQLYNSNLLAVDATPEVDQLLKRGQERQKRRVQQQAIGIMYFKLRLFNPDRYLSWVEPVLRPLLNRWGLLLWVAWILAALVGILPHWERLQGGFEGAIAPSNWGWLTAVFVVAKAIHETGHGVICKRFGGQVPEFGVMLLVLLPSPYVDASACWGFPSKWQRMAVGAGGMIFELALAAGAAFLWLNSAPGQLLHQIAYNAMLTASLSTVLFNANPLMRFDGYYILSDLLEIPNLMQRSQHMLKYLFQRHVYRMKQATAPSSAPGERAILVVYGLAAMAYRIFLFLSITLWLMGKLFAIGLVLAVWTAATWFLIPVGKFTHWLATSSQLAEFRARAIATSLLLIAGALLLVGAVPMPDRRRGVGVVESEARSGIFFGADGFLAEAHVRPGQRVRQGDPIVTCVSPELESRLDLAKASMDELRSIEREATTQNTAAAQVAREKILAQLQVTEMLLDRAARLVVRAPHDGVVVGGDPAGLVGAYAREGQMLCEVVDTERVRVAATMGQAEAAWLSELPRERYTVEMRLLSGVYRVVEGGAVRVVEAGQRRLPHAAIGFAGGGAIETEQDDRQGLVAKRPQWTVYVEAAGEAGGANPAGGGVGLPGERVSLRFSLPYRPLLGQWIDRLQKLLQGRVDI